MDFAELRALHCKGVSLKQLATDYGIEYGTLRVRASREKWRNTRNKCDNAVMQAVTDQMTGFADRHVRKVIGFADVAMDKLLTELAKDPNLTALEKIVGVANTLDQLGRRTAGLDKQDKESKPASLTVNVAITGGAGSAPGVHLGQVIDVEQVGDAGANADAHASATTAQLSDASVSDGPSADGVQGAKRKRVR